LPGLAWKIQTVFQEPKMAATNNAQEVWQSFDGEDFLHLLGIQGGTIVAYIDNAGTYHAGAATLNVAAQPTFRAVDSEPVLGFQGSTSITGSVVAVRGNITQSAGNTLASGFEYGVQGKLTLAGTLANGSGFNYGVFGQIDTSAATFVHTSGYLAPIGADFGATSIMASDANANMVSLTNTTNCIINSALQFIGNATYAFDLTDLDYGGAHFYHNSGSGLGSIGTDYLVVHVNGNVRHIALYA
jgi:hypothetical protein